MLDTGDIILTGVPRSGTTLACKLLSNIPDVVALNEPIRGGQFRSREEALDGIAEFYATTRQSILEKGVATARAVGGKMTDNHFARVRGKRERLVTKQEIKINKDLTPDFILACKHNALFTILQDQLLSDYPVFAFVRNPVAVLGSWGSVNVPVSRGVVRAMDHLLPEVSGELNQLGSLEERQLFILDWYFRCYLELPRKNVIKYEQVVATNGAALSVINRGAADLTEDLNSYNRSSIYDWEKLDGITRKLLDSDNACWSFYERREVESLVDKKR